MMNNTSSRLIPKKTMISVVAVCVLFVSLVFTAYAEEIIDEGSPYEAVVKGTVYDANTKLPIQNALVTIEYHKILRKDNTDSSGQYTFKHVPECFCLKNMTASKTGYMPQELWVAVSDVTVVDFYLNPIENNSQPTRGIVTGRVADADTNKPIEEAEMTITYHETIQVEYTDSNGQYTFENVPLCFCLKNVSASKKGYESQYQLIGASEVTYLNFSLEPIKDPEEPQEPEEPPKNNDGMYGTIKGMVSDAETNLPISKTLLTLKYHEIVRFEYTDSDGFYTFTEVPICFCLKNLTASREGYISENTLVSVHEITYVNFSLVPTETPQEPEDPKEPEEPEEPEKHNGVVTGVVIDSTTDLPINEVLIVLGYHDIIRSTFTDLVGKYTFTNVLECNCTKDISASKKGYECQNIQIAVYRITYINFSFVPIDDPEEPEEPPEPPEPPDSNGSMYGTLTGIVTDAESNEPIPDVVMTLKYHDLVRKKFTDSNGQYTFTNVPICFCLKNISASKTGYESQYKLVPVSALTYANFSMEPAETNPDGLPDSIRGKSKDKETSIESKGIYFAITGLLGILIVVIIIGIFLYTIEKEIKYRQLKLKK